MWGWRWGWLTWLGWCFSKPPDDVDCELRSPEASAIDHWLKRGDGNVVLTDTEVGGNEEFNSNVEVVDTEDAGADDDDEEICNVVEELVVARIPRDEDLRAGDEDLRAGDDEEIDNGFEELVVAPIPRVEDLGTLGLPIPLPAISGRSRVDLDGISASLETVDES